MSLPFDSFNPSTTRRDANNALALAMASKFVNETNLPPLNPPQSVPDATKATLQGISFRVTNFQLLAKDKTQCFIAGDDTKIVISFRDTADIQNWLADL
jgi:hypothetical protein